MRRKSADWGVGVSLKGAAMYADPKGKKPQTQLAVRLSFSGP
ncbi:hypothetical protein CHCC14821_0291 [Bacillus paralicheniformis]|nr:hypothetical protein CHCC14821_0291 [Bacillus paralicheniformis]